MSLKLSLVFALGLTLLYLAGSYFGGVEVTDNPRLFCLDATYYEDYAHDVWEFSLDTLLPGLWERRIALQTMADRAARRHGVDPALFRTLVRYESAWQPDAVSPKGAVGLAQLMPATAAEECGLRREQLIDPVVNLNCGAQYLAKQIKRFGNIETALCAYNAGPTVTARLGRCPDYPETVRYVGRIMETWRGG